MLRGIRKKFRGLKQQDRIYRREYDIDAAGRLVMDIRLERADAAYSAFSPAHDRRLDPELHDYAVAENKIIPNPIHIKFYNAELHENAQAQQTLQQTFARTFRIERNNLYRSLKWLNIKSFVFLLLGLLLILATVLMQVFSDSLVILFNSIEIFAWVFVWEAGDNFFFVRPDINRNYYHVSKLTEATYEFCP